MGIEPIAFGDPPRFSPGDKLQVEWGHAERAGQTGTVRTMRYDNAAEVWQCELGFDDGGYTWIEEPYLQKAWG
jgi:hypothetical protein